MARHPDVKEKEIIEAGLTLEQKGKMPNPGAIRAELGFRGGLVRIRGVWERYQSKRNGESRETEQTLSLDDLPTEIADAATTLIAQQKTQLERLIVCGFQRCQSLFDKRLDDHLAKHDCELAFYRDYEASADTSITKLEEEIKDTQTDLKELAEQNAKLLIENSKLSGQVVAFEKTLVGVSLPSSSAPAASRAKT
jgi:regulator of replication initiation timing